MKSRFKYYITSITIGLALTSCLSYHPKLINDEVVLKDENTKTGTILKCDSASIKIQHMDESMSIIPWTLIDTIQGKKYKTFFAGINFGYYNIPYFSVFRNEAMTGSAGGLQFKGGMALRKRRLFYANLLSSWAKPYGITKFGLGTQRYSKKGSYLSDKSFFWGGEFNIMNAKNNNGGQFTIDPFLGFEKKLTEQIRMHFKFALQFNLANKNNNTGFNFTIGFHALKRNFKKYYTILNQQKHLPVRKRGSLDIK